MALRLHVYGRVQSFPAPDVWTGKNEEKCCISCKLTCSSRLRFSYRSLRCTWVCRASDSVMSRHPDGVGGRTSPGSYGGGLTALRNGGKSRLSMGLRSDRHVRAAGSEPPKASEAAWWLKVDSENLLNHHTPSWPGEAIAPLSTQGRSFRYPLEPQSWTRWYASPSYVVTGVQMNIASGGSHDTHET